MPATWKRWILGHDAERRQLALRAVTSTVSPTLAPSVVGEVAADDDRRQSAHCRLVIGRLPVAVARREPASPVLQQVADAALFVPAARP